MPLWVGEVPHHERFPRSLLRAHPTRAAEALGLLECGFDIRHADVEDDVTVVAGATTDAAGNPGRVASGWRPLGDRLGC